MLGLPLLLPLASDTYLLYEVTWHSWVEIETKCRTAQFCTLFASTHSTILYWLSHKCVSYQRFTSTYNLVFPFLSRQFIRSTLNLNALSPNYSLLILFKLKMFMLQEFILPFSILYYALYSLDVLSNGSPNVSLLYSLIPARGDRPIRSPWV